MAAWLPHQRLRFTAGSEARRRCGLLGGSRGAHGLSILRQVARGVQLHGARMAETHADGVARGTHAGELVVEARLVVYDG